MTMDKPTTTWTGMLVQGFYKVEEYFETHISPHVLVATLLVVLWARALYVGVDVEWFVHILTPVLIVWEYKVAYQIFRDGGRGDYSGT